jgi:hypothetical protein
MVAGTRGRVRARGGSGSVRGELGDGCVRGAYAPAGCVGGSPARPRRAGRRRRDVEHATLGPGSARPRAVERCDEVDATAADLDSCETTVRCVDEPIDDHDGNHDDEHDGNHPEARGARARGRGGSRRTLLPPRAFVAATRPLDDPESGLPPIDTTRCCGESGIEPQDLPAALRTGQGVLGSGALRGAGGRACARSRRGGRGAASRRLRGRPSADLPGARMCTRAQFAGGMARAGGRMAPVRGGTPFFPLGGSGRRSCKVTCVTCRRFEMSGELSTTTALEPRRRRPAGLKCARSRAYSVVKSPKNFQVSRFCHATS